MRTFFCYLPLLPTVRSNDKMASYSVYTLTTDYIRHLCPMTVTTVHHSAQNVQKNIKSFRNVNITFNSSLKIVYISDRFNQWSAIKKKPQNSCQYYFNHYKQKRKTDQKINLSKEKHDSVSSFNLSLIINQQVAVCTNFYITLNSSVPEVHNRAWRHKISSMSACPHPNCVPW